STSETGMTTSSSFMSTPDMFVPPSLVFRPSGSPSERTDSKAVRGSAGNGSGFTREFPRLCKRVPTTKSIEEQTAVRGEGSAQVTASKHEHFFRRCRASTRPRLRARLGQIRIGAPRRRLLHGAHRWIELQRASRTTLDLLVQE